jgi:RNA-directed DNA polymerase
MPRPGWVKPETKLTRRDVMWRAWVSVATNQGAPGVDGVSIASTEEGGTEAVGAFLDELAAELEAETYRPKPLRRVNIPKPGQPGKSRPLSIPCLRDRVAMTAAKSILEPIFEADFLPCSFGFRPKKSAHQALEVVRTTANKGAVWVLDADISDCFGSLSFDAIMSQVGKRVSDAKMLKLIRAWLRVGVLEGGVVVTDPVTGAPQGSPVSPLLCNVVLHVLDEAWRTQGQGLGTLVRYADDFVVLAPTRARVIEAKARIEAILEPLGLHLHPDKTRISCLVRGQEGFVFLGFEHRMRESRKYRGRWYLHKWPSPRAMASIRAKVKERTARWRASWPMDEVVGNLNPVLRGRGNYFRYGNSSQKFTAIDSYVHFRMARLASTKYGLHGTNWATRFTYGWMTDLEIYRLSGTVRYWAASA